jgi:hypothetical protein
LKIVGGRWTRTAQKDWQRKLKTGRGVWTRGWKEQGLG